jgi:hypothetical protein
VEAASAGARTRLHGAPLAAARVGRHLELDRVAAFQLPRRSPLDICPIEGQEQARRRGGRGALLGPLLRLRCCRRRRGRLWIRIAHLPALAARRLLRASYGVTAL